MGLGNPGVRYERTRHNAGFMVADELARESAAGCWLHRCQSQVCPVTIAGEKALLAKPLTFMNVSGHAVQLLLAEYRIDPGQTIVIFDDFNLPLGRIRIRERGSAGGHRGMGSIIGALNSDEIVRVRLGVGAEQMPADKAEFALGEFPRHRTAELKEMIERAAQAVRMMIGDGVARAMSVFNA